MHSIRDDLPWRFQVLESLPDMRRIEPQWAALCQQARSPNAFFEPCFLLPALEHLDGDSVSLLCIWASEMREHMLAAMPLQARTTHYRLPMSNCALWRHTYCYLCSPLATEAVTERHLLETLRQLARLESVAPCYTVNWLDQQSLLASPTSDQERINWHIHRDTPFTRAGLKLAGSHNDFLRSLRTKKRKDLFRNKRRLAETGDYQIQVISGGSEPALQESAIAEFIDLENRGWKRQQGSSIASNPAHVKYFRQALQAGLSLDQVLITRISLDQQPVAMLIVLLSACGRAGYTQKMAIDTRFERYSPGSLVILELTEYVYSSTLKITELDSCAAQIHPMIDVLWRDRRSISNVVLAGRYNWRNPVISLVNAGRKIKNRVARRVGGPST